MSIPPARARDALIVLGVAVSLTLASSACTKKSADAWTAPSPSATTPAPATVDRAAYDRAIAGHEQWRPSSARCPIAMSPLPKPKPGQNLGQLALEQGPREGRLNTNVVKAFTDGKPLGAKGEAVDVLYVETERVDPALDEGTQTYTPGHSKGTAYVWDRAALRFACMAPVDARSSSEVTSLRKGSASAVLWLAMDLLFAIEREVATNARAIASEADAAHASDASADAGGLPADAGPNARAPDAGRKK